MQVRQISTIACSPLRRTHMTIATPPKDKRDAEGLRRTRPFAKPNERQQDRQNLAQRQQHDDAVRA